MNIYLCCALLLVACTPNATNETGPVVLKDVSEVKPWTAAVQVAAIQQGKTAQDPQERKLLSIELTHGGLTFSTKGHQSQLNKEAIEPAPEPMVDKTSEWLPERPPKTPMPPPVVAQPSVDLLHAKLDEIHYVGLITRLGDVTAMVRVGERLYPIKVGDMMGQGHWRVKFVDAQVMQLKVGERLVNYDKN